MSEDGTQGPVRGSEGDKTPFIVIGAALILLGLWSAADTLGGPWFDRVFEPLRSALRIARDLGWPLGLVLLGGALVMWTKHPGFKAPAKGARVMRSRSKRVLSGLMGGLSDYLGVDVVLLRLGIVAFALLFGVWTTAVAYVVGTLVVPEEPKSTVPGV